MIGINFCAGGRFEVRFSLRNQVLLKPGTWRSVAVTACTAANRNPISPWATIEDICLENCPGGRSALDGAERIGVLREFLCVEGNPSWKQMVHDSPAGLRCEHVFRELYESVPYQDFAFLPLKALDLLMFWGAFPGRKGRTFTAQRSRWS